MFDLLELFGLRDFTSSNKQASPTQVDMENTVDAGSSDLMPTQIGNVEDASASGPILSNPTQPAVEQTPVVQPPSAETTPAPSNVISPSAEAEYLRTKNPDADTSFPSIQSIGQEVLDQQPTPIAQNLTSEPIVAQPSTVIDTQLAQETSEPKYINPIMNTNDEEKINKLNNDSPVTWPGATATTEIQPVSSQTTTAPETPVSYSAPDLTMGTVPEPETPVSQSYPTTEPSPTVAMPEISMPVTEVNPQPANAEQPILPQTPATTEQPQQ